jgi:hypothetical protein
MDWYMWDMMMRYMDNSEARMQLEELERRGTEHGKQFDGLDKLINAYQVVIDKIDDWNSDQEKDCAIKEFFPLVKAQPLCVLFAANSVDRLATGEVRARGREIAEGLRRLSRGEKQEGGTKSGDINTRALLVSLKDTRNTQYKELRETLSKAPGLRIR